MVGYPHTNPKFQYVAADSALKCGGLPAAKDVVKALPDGPYQQEELVGGVVVDITLHDAARPGPAKRSETS